MKNNQLGTRIKNTVRILNGKLEADPRNCISSKVYIFCKEKQERARKYLEEIRESGIDLDLSCKLVSENEFNKIFNGSKEVSFVYNGTYVRIITALDFPYDSVNFVWLFPASKI